MYNLEIGTVDPCRVQAFLEGRREEARPAFVYKHRKHDIIGIAKDNDGRWLMLVINEHRMSRMFQIDSGLYYDGKFFYMSEAEGK